MRNSYRTTLPVFAVLMLAASGCSKEQSKKGLPPADNWQAPVGAQAKANPHASAGNPHAGMANNPHAGMADDPHAGMADDPHAGMAGDPHAGMAMGSNPHAGQGAGGVDVTTLGLQAPDPNRNVDPNKFLSGTIKPSSETNARVPPGSVIFLSVKRADANGKPTGSPLAVKRLVVRGWPMFFRVTNEDAMISGTSFEGDVVIVGWSDQDHDAIGKQPGDVIGQVRAKIPQKDLTLVLDTVVQ